MWGVIPAAGQGTRMQPLAFSKELLPVGSRVDDLGVERPRAVCEYLLERMIAVGTTKICFVISPEKADIPRYFGGSFAHADLLYAVQDEPNGLCDAIFRALPVIVDDGPVLIGLPDTIWFPDNGFALLPDDRLSFLLFPVQQPELFDAVLADHAGAVREIQVKSKFAATNWVWGAIKIPGSIFRTLHALWMCRDRQDQYLGSLVNAYLAEGGSAHGVRAGESYVDVGTLHGYREASMLVGDQPAKRASSPALLRQAAFRGLRQ